MWTLRSILLQLWERSLGVHLLNMADGGKECEEVLHELRKQLGSARGVHVM